MYQRRTQMSTKYTKTILQCHQMIAMSAQGKRVQNSILPHIFDTDSALIGVDNRASACMSDNIRDFSGTLQPTNRVIRGFAGTKTNNVQMGTIHWRIEDDQGKVTTHIIPNSSYVPDGKVRLLSPQHWAKALPSHRRPIKGIAPEMTFHDRVELRWDGNNSVKTIPMDPLTNVATFTLAPDYTDYTAFCAMAGTDDIEDDDDHPYCMEAEVVSDDENESVNTATAPVDGTISDDDDPDPQPLPMQPRTTTFDLDGPPTYTNTKLPVIIEDEEERQVDSASAEFLRYHQKFNHVSPKRIQLMAKQRILPFRLSKCPIPVCTACLYGKATKRNWRSKHSNNMNAAHVPTRPGEVISIDQMISPTAGLVAQNTGALTKARYKVATVFIDHATDYSYVSIQKSTSAEETIKSKMVFERNVYDQGIKVQSYHSDNGIFKSKAWQDHCYSNGQGLTFAGVNAHHQNGKAERRIRELQDMARTMLIHAKHRWPSAITANLWPYAIRMANDVLNATPSSKFPDGRIPSSSFSKSNVVTNPIHWHPFGCPVYVLSGAKQTTGIQHKWSERAKVGIYLGRSPQHAQSVALVLNLETGLVSPQFHVTFDPTFQTMRKQFQNNVPLSHWQYKAGFVNKPDDTSIIAPDTNQPRKSSNKLTTLHRPPQLRIHDIHHQAPDAQDQFTSSLWDTPITVSDQVTEATSNINVPEGVQEGDQSPQFVASNPLQRIITALSAQVDHLRAQPLTDDNNVLDLLSMEAIAPDADFDQYTNHPLLAMAASNDPDTLRYHEAMKAPDKNKFIQAMYDEVKGQLDSKVYSVILRSLVPQGVKVLPAVWAMRRKRKSSTGEVYKHKSRLNIGGHKQTEGIDYDQTYSPVVTWPSIRLLLTLTLVNKWHTRQIDFVQAYPQAPIERDMYMEVPKGFDIIDGDPEGDYVLQVHQNIYGQKQAGRVWNHYLVEHLLTIGFVQSEHDPCVFYKGRSIYILYTDDSILAGPDEQELDSIIQHMKDVGLNITSEGGIEDFLGINIARQHDGSFILTQQRLIDSILKDLGLNRTNAVPKQTPTASSKILSKHPESPAFDGHFHYRSVIGKLNYLEKSTRPDIAYAVHQCARFATDPRYEHGQAVKWLGRYLYGTRDQGIIFKPTKQQDLHLFVDSDWSGLWDKSIAATDSSTARSRHGFILEYCGCPVLWASQLQTEIALSSTEAEYIGLSKALRDAIPIMNILQEMKGLKYNIGGTNPKVHCKVFEDNSGALEMAKVHKFRPRTKHINIKYHHFRSYVNDDLISIHPITSANNPADMLTKGLGVNKLQANRFRVMGWNVDTEKGCENIPNTQDVPNVSTSILSEPTKLQASVGEMGTTQDDININLNPQQPVTAKNGIDDTSMDSQRSTMYENLASMCKESIYEDDSKYRLNLNDEFKLVTNKRFKKSNKQKVNNSVVTHTF
jgi:Reverse transcriptase (RNA-dependent DNA polymerase)